MTGIFVATEDVLSEAIADRLIKEENQSMYVAVRLGRKGNTYLKKELRSFTKIARSVPVLLFTDLDRIECPSILINDWRGRVIFPEMMLFRVVVRKIEAWLLADRQGFAQFSGVPFNRIPQHPESLSDPKESLLNLVRHYGKKAVKVDILPERGSTAKIGLAYNQALCGFVQGAWSLDRAAQAANSLDRARRRLHELRLTLADKK
ncbi:MAG: hypothetical protein EHM45_00780 [Desulfobacteraceae bacterium]|nr:MAG: hypothetical protein EHM45_00780 [Desulfobacteraceae bacterium]